MAIIGFPFADSIYIRVPFGTFLLARSPSLPISIPFLQTKNRIVDSFSNAGIWFSMYNLAKGGLKPASDCLY